MDEIGLVGGPTGIAEGTGFDESGDELLGYVRIVSPDLSAGLVATAVRSLTVALYEDVVDLILDGDGSILLCHDIGVPRRNETKHPLCPEAELGRLDVGIPGIEEGSEDRVVHIPSHEGLVPLLGVEGHQVVFDKAVEVVFARESISPVARIDRMQSRRRRGHDLGIAFATPPSTISL